MSGSVGNLDQKEDLEAGLKEKHRYEKQQIRDAALAAEGDALASQAKEVAERACSVGKSIDASCASRARFSEVLLTLLLIDAAMGVAAIPVAVGLVAGACVVQSAVLVGGCAVAAGESLYYSAPVRAVRNSAPVQAAKFTIRTAAFVGEKAVQHVRELL